MAFGLFLSCGSSRQPELVPAEVVGSRTEAIVTQSAPLTESWSRAMFGGGWPDQWSVKAISGTALNMVTQTMATQTAPFGAYGLSGRANGGPTDFSIQYLNTPGASFVDSTQTVKLATNSNTTWGGLIARANVETKTFYGCWVGSGSTSDRLRLFKVVNGVLTTLAHSPHPAANGLAYMAEDEWHNLELSVTQSGSSTSLKARLWLDGTAAPGWTLTATDAEPVLQNYSGKVGIAARGGQINRLVYFDEYQGPSVTTTQAGPLQYRPVTYAREVADHFVVPTTTPNTSPASTPALKGNNRFILNVPVKEATALSFTVGNQNLPSNPGVDVIITDANGADVQRATLPSDSVMHSATTTLNITKAFGNYEVLVVPRDPALTYSIATAAGVSFALIHGAELVDARTVHFFVPRETDDAFLVAKLDPGTPLQLTSPDGASVSTTYFPPDTYAFHTAGKPGIWHAHFRTQSGAAHLLNLPDIFSFDPNAVISSQRIRTALQVGVPTTPVTTPYLRGDNRFLFHVASASTPAFTFAVENSSTTPPPAVGVRFFDALGDPLPSAAFDLPIAPSTMVSPGQTLQPGDYELHIRNYDYSTRYKITSPAGVSFVAVDTLYAGSVWFPSYREFFHAPSGAGVVQFHSSNAATVFKVYDPNGAVVPNQPVSLSNNIFQVQTPTAGSWGLNILGATKLRLLNAPQLIAFDSTTLGTVGGTQPPGGACSSYFDCQSGLSCVVGTCQDCANGGCAGGGCSATQACMAGLACTAGTCHALCDAHPDEPGCLAATCTNGSKDANETGVDCGGNCPMCQSGDGCTTDADCAGGLVCGTNNGGCFGGPRINRICWPAQCQDGIAPTECGQTTSPCGSNCDCVVGCDADDSAQTCPAGEECKRGGGVSYGPGLDDACVTAGQCPSNDPATCGSEWSLCGQQCTPNTECPDATNCPPSAPHVI